MAPSPNYLRIILLLSTISTSLLAAFCIACLSWALSHNKVVDGQSVPEDISTVSAEKLIQCGPTAKEARERNCVFDPLTVTWQLPSCPKDGVQEFFEYGEPYKYWHANGDQSEITTYDELSNLEFGPVVFLTTHKEHMAHCLFLWLRLQMSLARGVVPDAVTRNVNHTRHCINYILGLTEHLKEVVPVDMPEFAGDIGWTTC